MGFLDWFNPYWQKPSTPTPPAAPAKDIVLPAEPKPLPTEPAKTPSEVCIALIKREEGFEATAYPDFNGYAIGYGCHDVDGKPVVKGQTIDTATADRACRQKAQQCATAILPLVKRTLKQNELDALIDFAYNVGLGSLETSTILKTINTNGVVTEDMFTRWNKEHDPKTGAVIVNPGLTERRQAEYKLWSTP
jgi:lysozyme